MRNDIYIIIPKTSMFIIEGFINFLTLINAFGPLCIWSKLGNNYDILMGASGMCVSPSLAFAL